MHRVIQLLEKHNKLLSSIASLVAILTTIVVLGRDYLPRGRPALEFALLHERKLLAGLLLILAVWIWFQRRRLPPVIDERDRLQRLMADSQSKLATTEQAADDLRSRVAALEDSVESHRTEKHIVIERHAELSREFDQLNSKQTNQEDWKPPSESAKSWHNCAEPKRIQMPNDTGWHMMIRVSPQQAGRWRAGLIFYPVDGSRPDPTLLYHLYSQDEEITAWAYWGYPLVQEGVNLGEPKRMDVVHGGDLWLHYVRRQEDIVIGVGGHFWRLGAQELGVELGAIGAPRMAQWCDTGVAHCHFVDGFAHAETGEIAQLIDELVLATMRCASRVELAVQAEAIAARTLIPQIFTAASKDNLSRVDLHNGLYRHGVTNRIVTEATINLASVQGLIEALPAEASGGNGFFRLAQQTPQLYRRTRLPVQHMKT